MYTTILAGIYFASALQVALVVGPLLVLVPGLPADKQRCFASALLLFNVLLSIAVSLVTICIYLLLFSSLLTSGSATLLIAGLSYLWVYQAQEFFRRLLQVHSAFLTASVCDLASLVVILLLLSGMWFLKSPSIAGQPITLTAGDGLLILCLSGIIGISIAVSSGKKYLSFKHVELTNSVRESWTIGGWSVVTVLCDSLFSYSSTYIVAGLVGAAAVARLEGPRLLVAPIQVLSLSIRSYLIPTVAGLVAAGFQYEAGRKLRVALLGTGLMAAAYCIAISALPASRVKQILGSAYETSGSLLPWWAGAYFFLSLNAIPWIAVLVMRRVKISTVVTFFLGCGVTAGTWVAARHGSLEGVLAVRLVAGCALVTAGIWFGGHLLGGSVDR
jgi:O-antigen/teichoic acid export membrane protein